MRRLLIISLLFLIICCLGESSTFKSIGKFTNGRFKKISIPSGISSVLFTGIPEGSTFIVIQLHSPFNSLLASTVPSFDYGASQLSEHCGLVSKLSSGALNSTLYIYSAYESNITGWVRADGYNSVYAVPGGCGRYMPSGSAWSSITPAISVLPNNQRKSNASSVSLGYWTSVLKFNAAAFPRSVSNDTQCLYISNATAFDGTLTYYLYSTPLVTAGGCYGAFKNPTPEEVASVLDVMSSPEPNPGSLVYSFSLSPDMLDAETVEIPVARRPGIALVFKLVVEYRGSDGRTRVPYTPVVLYGCPNLQPERRGLGSGFVVRNHSTQLSCGILPSNSPSTYFPVAVLLLASVFYGYSCNLLIWPRCAASVMFVASFIGLLVFFRYSVYTADAALLLAVSLLIPALLALFSFLLLWCICVRPTLQYQQIFGRGPLLKVIDSDGSADPNTIAEPWNADLIDIQAPNSANPPPWATGENYDPLIPSSSGSNESDPRASVLTAVTSDVTCPSTSCCSMFSSCSRPATESKRQTKVLSLRPRRLARLPPVLPATLLIVFSLSILLDRTLPMKESKASYLSFLFGMSILVLCPMCVFKNFAFGLSTALVGGYVSLCCSCLFFINNALLPHILIEPFLRLAWMEQRLQVLRIETAGQYDVLLIAVWIAGTVAFGLLTLFLVRLQDVRELSAAQRTRPFPLYSEVILPNPSARTDAPTISVHDMQVGQSGGHVPHVSVVHQGGGYTAGIEQTENAGLIPGPVSTSSQGISERTNLLPCSSRISYGGLAVTPQSAMVPLSRVQLAAKNRPVATTSRPATAVLHLPSQDYKP